MLYAELWGLNEFGHFRTPTDTAGWCARRNDLDVQAVVLKDLLECRKKTEEALSNFFNRADVSDLEKRQRIAQLFMQDLMSGLSGSVVEGACDREMDLIAPIAADQRQAVLLQVAGSIALVMLVGGMLFYLFLFSVRQSATNQREWWNSLVMWMLMDALLLSTANVFFTHFLLPAFTMKDVRVVEQKLRECVRQCKQHKHDVDAHSESNDKKQFDSSEYFFVSKRVAHQFPHLPESEWVLSFSTPWPRRSYTHVADLNSDYNGSGFTTTATFVSALGMFILSTYVQLPTTVQDLVTQIAAASGLGYFCVLLVRLYNMSPALAFALLLPPAELLA